MDIHVEQLVETIAAADDLSANQRAQCEEICRAIRWDLAEDFLGRILHVDPPLPGSHFGSMLGTSINGLAGRLEELKTTQTALIQPATREHISRLYKHLRGDGSPRPQLLRMLAISGENEDLYLFAELLTDDPPSAALGVQLALSPFFQVPPAEPGALFPRLLDALGHPSAAAAVLDVANFFTRQGHLPQHPASGQTERLIDLLGGITASLESIEKQRPHDEHELKRLQAQVAAGVALASSLTDALALTGDTKAVPAISHVMQLAHRRTRTEAAAALARLGDSQGEEELVRLAAHPVSRLRVLAYAEELNIGQKIPDEYQTPLARAEGELAAYLAEPASFGLPPDVMEMIDCRTQYWPGYEQPVECFLFQFAYHLPQGTYENVGLAGPATHAFAADVTGLSVEDAYAAFAGWLAEHGEIAEVAADELNAEQQLAVEKIVEALTRQGCVDVTPVKLGYFFGEWPLVVTGRYQDASGTAVADREGIEWFASDPGQLRPLGPDEAYNIWKGRRLLAAFNP